MSDENTSGSDRQKNAAASSDTATGEGSESPEEGAKAEKAAEDAVVDD